MNDIIWLTMRRMRTPLIVMILTYSLTVFGMVMIPAHDAAGEPVQVGYLDAAYFVAIMATTIGFGEIPYTFSHVQRLYVYIALFPNVIAWLYSIGTIISLFVDPQFRAVLALSRFSRNVRRIRGDYYIVCGFGYTGRMVVAGLLKRGISATIEEWLNAAEYIYKEGNHHVILCERGIRTFETSTRNTLDISAVPVIKELSHLPVIVDPSHSGGRRSLVESLTRTAVAAGADGFMVDVHPAPETALVDGPQAILPAEFADLMDQVRALLAVMDSFR